MANGCQTGLDTDLSVIKRELSYRCVRLEDVAQTLGVNLSYVSLVLSGKRPRDGGKARRIVAFCARVADVDPVAFRANAEQWMERCAAETELSACPPPQK